MVFWNDGSVHFPCRIEYSYKVNEIMMKKISS